MIKAIIFDLDDTLVNTWPWHRQAMDAALKPYNVQLADLEPSKLHNIVGRRTRDAFEFIRHDLGVSAPRSVLEDARRTVFEALRESGQTLLPGTLELLERLKAASLRLVVVSSGKEPYVLSVLEKWQIKQYFDDIIGGDEVTKGKPDPEPYLNALKYLQLPASDCVVIEDSQSGIESAKSAGCYCVAVRNSNIPPQDYAKADGVVDALINISIDTLQKLQNK
ncbi:MAG: HAD family phosphatase [Patescibacteria group bacterium]